MIERMRRFFAGLYGRLPAWLRTRRSAWVAAGFLLVMVLLLWWLWQREPPADLGPQRSVGLELLEPRRRVLNRQAVAGAKLDVRQGHEVAGPAANPLRTKPIPCR